MVNLQKPNKNNMKFIYPTAFAASLILISSCGGSPEVDLPEIDQFSQEDEKEEVSKEPIEVSWDDINKRDFEDGQILIFKSYVAPLSTSLFYSGGEVPLDFHPRRHQTHGFHLRVDVPIGTSENHIKSIPSKYDPVKDVVIYTKDGGTAKVGDYVQIRGVWSKASDEGYDYLDLTTIEVIDAEEELVLEDVGELTNELIEGDAETVYAYVDASMELSMFMSSFDQVHYSIDLSQSNNKYLKKAYVMIGSGPSTMNLLETGFTNKDFIVRDSDGNELAAIGKKFRLFGTFRKSEYDKEQKGSFYVEEIVPQ